MMPGSSTGSSGSIAHADQWAGHTSFWMDKSVSGHQRSEIILLQPSNTSDRVDPDTTLDQAHECGRHPTHHKWRLPSPAIVFALRPRVADPRIPRSKVIAVNTPTRLSP